MRVNVFFFFFCSDRRASGGAPLSAGKGRRASSVRGRASTAGDLLTVAEEGEEEEEGRYLVRARRLLYTLVLFLV